MKKCLLIDLGRIDYLKCLEIQKKICNLRYENKIEDTLILAEHEPVITQGIEAKKEEIKYPERINEEKIKIYKIDRGGKTTYHGPGQLVGYPIIKLNSDKRDILAYVHKLEEVIIGAVKKYGIFAEKLNGFRGVWVKKEKQEEKLAAIGIEIRKGISMHGFALNINTNLKHFGLIIPCGNKDKKPISLEEILGYKLDLNNVKDNIINSFSKVFNTKMIKKDLGGII